MWPNIAFICNKIVISVKLIKFKIECVLGLIYRMYFLEVFKAFDQVGPENVLKISLTVAITLNLILLFYTV